MKPTIKIENEKPHFSTHSLSKIDKSMIGVLGLATRLVEIQYMIISKCLPDIVKKINERLNAPVSELNKLPGSLTRWDSVSSFLSSLGFSFHARKEGEPSLKIALGVAENVREHAFDLKMRMTAYWEIVLRRIYGGLDSAAASVCHKTNGAHRDANGDRECDDGERWWYREDDG
ncbi:hypothetical protein OSB04_015333 [Centaurea solstitialis]|uniref:Dynamin stalk domain-containing protein n=1 Tax=Centaurea solstitialis TaxID=347529 RepID=A0AA38TIT0_9ASTR|nr:hypothetical protein OSB04_015333 [Centaurea solstitialis]